MDLLENLRAAAAEIVQSARERGLDLEPLLDRTEAAFVGDGRWIFAWRYDGHSYRGADGEDVGTLNYQMQGTIARLPSLTGSSDESPRVWLESGACDCPEQMVDLVKGWLIDRLEVDALPARRVRLWRI